MEGGQRQKFAGVYLGGWEVKEQLMETWFYCGDMVSGD